MALDRTRHRLYVANSDDDTVSVLDMTSGDVLDTLSVGRLPHALAVESRSGCVYVANALSNSVSVIACDGAA
jgi:YVTN family beta-propeller protein